MKIIGTGLSGLVGSRIVELLSGEYQFEDISRKTGTDITNYHAVLDRIKNSEAEIVLHLAAKTDVDGCERDKEQGENGEAWKINVLGTQHVVKACEDSGKKIIFISTDFVFSGNDTPEKGYTEENATNPVNWYGKTKVESEKVVEQAKTPWVIMRIGTPYRADFTKKDFMRFILSVLQEKKEIRVVKDQKFNPTFIDDIAFVLKRLIENKEEGIFHVFGSQTISPYEGVLEMADIFALNKNLIKPVTYDEFFANRAKRPIDLTMNNDKISNLGILMRGWIEGLEEVKRQL